MDAKANRNPVCFFEIPASDTARVKQFYGDLFAWTTSNAPGEGGYFFLHTTKPESVEGAIVPRSGDASTPRVFVQVEKLDEMLKRVTELGGNVVVAKTALPQLGWIATATDIEGNSFGLFQPDPSASN